MNTSFFKDEKDQTDLIEVYTKSNHVDQPLHTAVKSGDINLVRKVIIQEIEAQRSINVLGSYGMTALHRAVKTGKIEMVKLFTQLKADLNITDDAGSTPIFYAAEKGYEDIAKLLIAAGADIHIRNNSNNTAYDVAHVEGYENIFNLLKSSDQYNQRKINLK